MTGNQKDYLDTVDERIRARCGVPYRELLSMCPGLVLAPANTKQDIRSALDMAIRDKLNPVRYADIAVKAFRLMEVPEGAGPNDILLTAQKNRHLAAVAEMCRHDDVWVLGTDGSAYRESEGADAVFRISADMSSRGGGFILSEAPGHMDLDAQLRDSLGRMAFPKEVAFTPVHFGFDLDEPVTAAARIEGERHKDVHKVLAGDSVK